jgi:hypothetical protein
MAEAKKTEPDAVTTLYILAADSGGVTGVVEEESESMPVRKLLAILAQNGAIACSVVHTVTIEPDGEEPTTLGADDNTFGLHLGEHGYLTVRQKPSAGANLIPVHMRHSWYRSARRNIAGLELKATLIDLMLQPFDFSKSVRMVTKLLLVVAAVARHVPAFKSHVSIGDIEERCGNPLNTDVERWLYILYRVSEFFTLPKLTPDLLKTIDVACASAAEIYVVGSDGPEKVVL